MRALIPCTSTPAQKNMTTSALMDNPCPGPHSHVPAKVLLIATWFGLATGLLEGTCLLAFQELGWLNWDMALKGVSLEIIWIAALFDLLLADTAEQFADPAFMNRGHRAELGFAGLGQPHHRGAAITIAPGARDEPFRDKPIDDAGDVSVGDQKEAREVAHQHALRTPGERRHHVEARQRRVEFLLQPLTQFRLDRAGGAQQPDPEP